MAYPAIEAPYGLRPIGLIGSRVYAGAFRQFPIASGSATPIFNGDVVRIASNGTVVKETGTSSATPVGVFLGCSYTDPVFGKVFRQHYPGGVTAADIMAHVCDDPDTLFKVAVVSSGTTIASVTRTVVGNNTSLVQNAGNAVTGNSAVAASASTATTATLPLRIVDVVEETHVPGDPAAYTEVIVKWNFGMHQYQNATGV
ncbi:MAG: hypothetical protein ACK4WM_09180 [Thermoflexales bacterium]